MNKGNEKDVDWWFGFIVNTSFTYIQTGLLWQCYLFGSFALIQIKWADLCCSFSICIKIISTASVEIVNEEPVSISVAVANQGTEALFWKLFSIKGEVRVCLCCWHCDCQHQGRPWSKACSMIDILQIYCICFKKSIKKFNASKWGDVPVLQKLTGLLEWYILVLWSLFSVYHSRRYISIFKMQQ